MSDKLEISDSLADTDGEKMNDTETAHFGKSDVLTNNELSDLQPASVTGANEAPQTCQSIIGTILEKESETFVESIVPESDSNLSSNKETDLKDVQTHLDEKESESFVESIVPESDSNMSSNKETDHKDVQTHLDVAENSEMIKNFEKNAPVKSSDTSTMEVEMDCESMHRPRATLLSSLHLEENNFFKGCKWAPDGLCLMTNSDDNVIRLINTPAGVLTKQWGSDKLHEVNACLELKEAETIYDYTWWPLMNSLYPATCCLATTARDQPIHLWDAFNGSLRATYIAKNQVDEVKAARCIAFSPDGMQMICGFNRELRLFYVDRPGDVCEIWPTKREKCSSGQKGIISTAEFSPDASSFACGCYDGTAAVYSSKNGNLTSLLNCGGGVTHVKYSPDGNRLYAGLRKSQDLICWDVRYLRGAVFQIKRVVDTNQRIYFDLTTRTLCNRDMGAEEIVLTGNTDGHVSVWDVGKWVNEDFNPTHLDDSPKLEFEFQAHRDCANGVHMHPFLPVVATSSGQRHFTEFSDSDDDDDEKSEGSGVIEENCLKFWHIQL